MATRARLASGASRAEQQAFAGLAVGCWLSQPAIRFCRNSRWPGDQPRLPRIAEAHHLINKASARTEVIDFRFELRCLQAQVTRDCVSIASMHVVPWPSQGLALGDTRTTCPARNTIRSVPVHHPRCHTPPIGRPRVDKPLSAVACRFRSGGEWWPQECRGRPGAHARLHVALPYPRSASSRKTTRRGSPIAAIAKFSVRRPCPTRWFQTQSFHALQRVGRWFAFGRGLWRMVRRGFLMFRWIMAGPREWPPARIAPSRDRQYFGGWALP